MLTVHFDADCQVGAQFGMPASACDRFECFSLVLTVQFDAHCQMGVQSGKPTSACDRVLFSSAHCPV